MSGSQVFYAVFRYNGQVVSLTEGQYKQALRDGRICRCGQCLACRVVEYHNDAKGEKEDAT